jgi:predicted TPR repeat methyltransferase
MNKRGKHTDDGLRLTSRVYLPGPAAAAHSYSPRSRTTSVSGSTSCTSSTSDDSSEVHTRGVDLFKCSSDGSSLGVWSVPLDNKYITSSARGIREIHRLELRDAYGTVVLASSLMHDTSGPVPRGTTSSIIRLEAASASGEAATIADEQAVLELLEGSMRWYLDNGGRISRLSVAFPSDLGAVRAGVGRMGFLAPPLFTDEFSALHGRAVPASNPGYSVLGCEPEVLVSFLSDKCSRSGDGDKRYRAHLLNLVGRLLHDTGRPADSIDYYTRSLQLEAGAASVFRNLGSAYQSNGNAQMAFASFQQAVQLDPSDAMVYLKLAFFYEDFAKMDWDDAGDHAERCYRYYLENVDAEDTSILTRLGNLLVREHRSGAAVDTYEKVLSLDGTLHNVWFNKAHAHIKLGQNKAAMESLRRTLELDPNVAAAAHMLKALSADESQSVSVTDEQYIRDLFDEYGKDYDAHVKKLLYSAPRVVRQELARIYKGRFNIAEDEVRGVPAGVDDGGGCTVVVPTIKINNTLDILDLGCGTGLAGAWLKDYANTLTGVDLSEGMAAVARKKLIYKDISVTSIDQYLRDIDPATHNFDLVVAVDVLSYIGELEGLFRSVSRVMRPDAHFAFTVEAISKDARQGVNVDEEEARDALVPARTQIDPEVEVAAKNGQHRGFQLLRSGRFGYAKAYVDGVLGAMEEGDIEVVLSRQFSPRLDAGNPVPGYLYVVHKKKVDELKEH